MSQESYPDRALAQANEDASRRRVLVLRRRDKEDRGIIKPKVSQDKPALEALDFKPLGFGIYKGRTPEEISFVDPGYVCWMYGEIKPAPCSEALRNDCAKELKPNQQFDPSGFGALDTYDKFTK